MEQGPEQQRRSFDVYRSLETWQTTPTVADTLRVDLYYQNKPINTILKCCDCNLSNAFKATMQDIVDKKVTLFVYKQILWCFHCHDIAQAINLKRRGPRCAPPFASICESFKSLEREEIWYKYEKCWPFLWSSSFFVIFNFSHFQYWAPTYGKTHPWKSLLAIQDLLLFWCILKVYFGVSQITL